MEDRKRSVRVKRHGRLFYFCRGNRKTGTKKEGKIKREAARFAVQEG